MAATCRPAPLSSKLFIASCTRERVRVDVCVCCAGRGRGSQAERGGERDNTERKVRENTHASQREKERA